jgi:hypothetical protein
VKTYHLRPTEGEWVLSLEGEEKPIASFDGKNAALSAARNLADRRGGDLKVFRNDGTIEEVRRRPALSKTPHEPI